MQENITLQIMTDLIIVNINTNYKLGEKWSSGIFFTYQTGRPTTLPTSRININGTSYLNYSDRNAFRISDTHRMDVSFTYTPKNTNKRWQSSWSFGVYNIYGHKNAFSKYSIFKNGALKDFSIFCSRFSNTFSYI